MLPQSLQPIRPIAGASFTSHASTRALISIQSRSGNETLLMIDVGAVMNEIMQ